MRTLLDGGNGAQLPAGSAAAASGKARWVNTTSEGVGARGAAAAAAKLQQALARRVAAAGGRPALVDRVSVSVRRHAMSAAFHLQQPSTSNDLEVPSTSNNLSPPQVGLHSIADVAKALHARAAAGEELAVWTEGCENWRRRRRRRRRRSWRRTSRFCYLFLSFCI